MPATHTPSFEVSPDARVVPVNELPAAAGSASSYAVLGSGKTAVDACMWLLDNGVAPDRIRWVRPREAWFLDRAHVPAARPGRRDHRGPLPRRRGRRPGDRRRRPLRPARGLGAALPHRPVAAGDDVPRHDAQRARAARRAADRGRGQARPRPAHRGRPDRARAGRGRDRSRRPARRLHRARPAQRPGRRRSSSPTASCSSRCARTRRASTRRSSASSRPTGMTTPRRTGSARPTPTRAASRTGRG